MFAFNRIDDDNGSGLTVPKDQDWSIAQTSNRSQQVLEMQFAKGAIRKLSTGQMLWSAGDDREHLYIVRSGCLRLSEMLPDGRRVIQEFAFPGDIIGHGCDVHDLDAEAVEPTRLDSMSVRQYQRAIAEDPAFVRAMKGIARSSLRSTREHVTVLSRMAGGERVAHFIVEMAERNRRSGRDPHKVRLPMRRIDVADYLGLTTETICRTLTAFRKHGLISTNQSDEVLLLDLKRLQSLASGESDPNDPLRRAS